MARFRFKARLNADWFPSKKAKASESFIFGSTSTTQMLEYPNACCQAILTNEMITLDMALKDRLTVALEFSGVNKSQLARAIGVSRATVTDWCNGNTVSMKSRYVPKAAAKLGVQANWLSDGEGEMVASNSEMSLKTLEVVFRAISDKIEAINTEFHDAPPQEKALYLKRFFLTAIKNL